MARQYYKYTVKIIIGIVNNKPYYHNFEFYKLEDAIAMCRRAAFVNTYSEVRVQNTIHECRYMGREFIERYENGQRRFIRSNHPTFTRWRPERSKHE